MSTHTNHNELHQVYFCTITCYQWLPLFEEANAYDEVYKWFDHLRKDGCAVVGYVIMPNHIHCLLYPTLKYKPLNKLVSEGKRFIAYGIVNKLKRLDQNEIIAKLESGVQKNEQLKGKKHQVFRLSFDAKLCYNERMLEQKLDYIHRNPASGKWSLVDDFAKYEHSSAGFYELNENVKTEIGHYKELGSVPEESSESLSGDSEGMFGEFLSGNSEGALGGDPEGAAGREGAYSGGSGREATNGVEDKNKSTKLPPHPAQSNSVKALNKKDRIEIN